jgi:excinuclease UvrABC ATPase subunit
VELALKKGNGLVTVNLVDENKDFLYSQKLSCPECGLQYRKWNQGFFF